MHRFSQCPDGWQNLTFGDVTIEQNLRVGALSEPPVVLSCTKHYGLIPSNEYFKNRTIYSNDLTAYKRVTRDWFSYATNHLAEGSIGRQSQFDDSCVSPIYTVFSCSAGIFPPYLERVLKSSPVLQQYKVFEQATVDRRGAVRYLDFARIPIQFPPEFEQVKISDVLDTLDAVIRQTEAIVEKLKQVKQGLLHDLLTRGVGANGELRPPQSQAPHLYKDSLLGSIPRTWSVERLDGLLSNEQPAMRSGPFGSALLKSEQVESGVPLLGIDNVHTEEFIDKFTRFIPITKFHELSRYAVRPDDLMITIMGTVGRCCLVPSGIGRALSSKHTWTITLDQSKYSPLLAMLQINYSLRILEQLARDEQGGIMSAIRSDTLRSLNFPVPPIKEQIEMVERMQAITSRINTESEVLRKLTCEKLGLMEDLLTGRVRVTSLLGTTDA